MSLLKKISELSGFVTGSYEFSNSKQNVMDITHNPSSKSEIVPYLYEDQEYGLFINENANLGFVIETLPLVSIDTREVQQIESFFRDQLPKNHYVQFLVFASKDIDQNLQRWLADKESMGDVDEFFERRALYLKEIAENQKSSSIRARNFRCFISFSIKGTDSVTDPRGVFKSTGKKISLIDRQKLYNTKKQFVTLLDTLCIPFTDVDASKLKDLTKKIINTEQESELTHVDSHKPINKQLKGGALTVCAEEIEFNGGEYVGKAFSVDKFPDEIYIGSVSALLGDQYYANLNLNCDFLISYTIANDVSQSRLNSLKIRALNAHKNAESLATRFDPSAPKTSQEWFLINQALEEGECFYTANFQIFIKARKDSIEIAEQQLRSIFSKNSWQISLDKYFQLPALISMLPMTASALWEEFKYIGHYKTALLSEALALLPIYGDWKGTFRQGMMLLSRRGQMCPFSIFEETGSNYNACIVAPSGGGKSVFTQELILNEIRNGVKVIILDIGRSYKNIATLVDGDFIEFTPTTNISLNPFTNIDSVTEADSLDYIKTILYLMAGPSGNLTDLQKSILSEALLNCWDEYKNETTITKIAQYLNKSNQKEAQDLATMLGPYTDKGLYGKYFEPPATIEFNKKLTVFELEEIAPQEELLAVVMQVASIQIMQKLSGDRKQKFVVGVEEAWRILRKSAALFVGYVRTFRKYGGSLIIITQGYKDFTISNDAKAIWDNSAWHIFLPHSDDAVKTLKATNDFDHAQLELINSLKMVPSSYSEIYIDSNVAKVVQRLVLDKYSRTLFSTNNVTFNQINQSMQNGATLMEAVEAVARNSSL